MLTPADPADRPGTRGIRCPGGRTMDGLMTGHDWLRPVVADAVVRCGIPGSVFTTSGFAKALRENFGIRWEPNPDWSRTVLDQLEYVARLDGCFWSYLG